MAGIGLKDGTRGTATSPGDPAHRVPGSARCRRCPQCARRGGVGRGGPTRRGAAPVQVLPPLQASRSRSEVPRGGARALLHQATGAVGTVAPGVPIILATRHGGVGPALGLLRGSDAHLLASTTAPGTGGPGHDGENQVETAPPEPRPDYRRWRMVLWAKWRSYLKSPACLQAPLRRRQTQ